MNEKKRSGAAAPKQAAGTAASAPAKPYKPKKKGGLLGRIIRRFFLLLFTIIILAVVALVLVMNTIFHGPSPAATEMLTMALTEASATKWVPGLFLEEDVLNEIRAGITAELPDDVTDTSQVVINRDSVLSGGEDAWANYPEGIRIEHYSGKTFNAHIMLIKDPSRVYMATSSEKFSTDIPGKRITEAIEIEGAAAAINAGAFYDDGTANSIVGSVPCGLVMKDGEAIWNAYSGMVPQKGFVGFDKNNILVVAKSMTEQQALDLGIQDGCEFGPVLIMNGQINEEAYGSASGLNPRTAIGQAADGSVIFLCIDGRQVGSLGGTFKDVIDIMVEYGAVNACNLDGGSSSVMLHRNSSGEVEMVNSYSLMQSQPRRMPNYWMVRPLGE